MRSSRSFLPARSGRSNRSESTRPRAPRCAASVLPSGCHATVIPHRDTALLLPTSSMTPPPTSPDGEAIPFLDRDHSILAFNERVLDWARRDDVPLLERLRYLCIVSSNLDEFFEVRAAPHLQAHAAGEQKGNYTAESFEALSLAAHALVERQYALY